MNETFSRAKFEKFLIYNYDVEVSRNWDVCNCPLAMWAMSMGYDSATVDPLDKVFKLSDKDGNIVDDLSEEFENSWAEKFASTLDFIEEIEHKENELPYRSVTGEECLAILSKIKVKDHE